MSLLTGALPIVETKVARFHISLNVSDLEKSIRFYSILFDRQPDKRRDDYAKFEPDHPPLVVSLEPNGRCGGGTLNHLGIRLPDARQLVSVQERLERAGIRSQREEGVECCYARQTKFWVQDPDGTLWEFYTLDEDELDHRGAGQSLEVMTSSTLPEEATVWEHMLGTPIPLRSEACENSTDEVRLRGSLNVPLGKEEKDRLLEEAIRMLKPGGRLLIRILSGDREHPAPELPGKGAPVRFVPAKDDVVGWIAGSKLEGIRLLKYDDPPCFQCDGVTMRETHLEAFKPITKA
ncbi:Cadmium-induced protein CadI [Pirellula sp. SH-Sr6A]|uniref:ArsI/CadI family heavy metal resistance metalloenzyme n=1 Tax=Pirellula sp. SH-Sr6A TaxID=1632865 RepID=UPI00078B7FE7|nr:ArsI/CadI family heavy metal resistance metalloenzyme [Pirellula sp. SH-Sr6A]AMV33204.1 Cadmium-induced protein CadI [Pirellula sp. SH-Sr6A]